MNGGRRKKVTSEPFNNPIRPPKATPMTTAAAVHTNVAASRPKPRCATIQSGAPSSTLSLPMINMQSTRMALTERSMPAVRMMAVCAIATMPVTVTCCSTSDNVLGRRKLGAIAPKNTMLATRIKAGIAVGLLRRSPRALRPSDLSSRSNAATDVSAFSSRASKSEMTLVGPAGLLTDLPHPVGAVFAP